MLIISLDLYLFSFVKLLLSQSITPYIYSGFILERISLKHNVVMSRLYDVIIIITVRY